MPKLDITYKCKAFCSQGTSTFENTGIKPLTQIEKGHITDKGEICSKCEQLKLLFRYRDMKKIIENMSKPGFDLSNYKAPGQIADTSATEHRRDTK